MISLTLLQALVPFAAILWLALGRPATLLDFSLRLVAAMALTFAAAQAGIWLALPRATVTVLAVFLVVAAILAYRRVGAAGAPDAQHRRWAIGAGRAVTVAGAAAGTILSGVAVAGHGQASPSVDLGFPFDEGRYIVIDGGTTGLINRHVASAGSRDAALRGRSHGVDLVRVDRIGFRTRDPVLLTEPEEPTAYRIVGSRVVAPCSGIVDRLDADQVVLRCRSNLIILSPLEQDGIVVAQGQIVEKGKSIGEVSVGREGGEPHFHIHAQRVARAGQPPMSGAPVGIRFANSQPVRNSQFAIK